MTELIAPAGCFSTAIYGLNQGADAVYLGLQKFSARSSGKNFSIEQLKKLKAFCLENNKKIYITLNTIIKDDELKEVFNLLYLLEKLQVNGVIIQDLGIFEIIKTYFNSLKIHASTQMAVYNDAGVKYLKSLGFKRIVLARELSFLKIKEIREKNPDIELEVFIHGALCYSFSGLCLSSGILLNRSSNRGECAQVCRNFYTLDNKNLYCFSCNDLSLEKDVLKLKDIGIDSFKIEGRMKSPEYVFYTVKLYDQILKSQNPNIDQLKKNIQLCFSRKETKFYFDPLSKQGLINNKYSEHKGINIGKVISSDNKFFKFKTNHDLCFKDGLMFFIDNDYFKPYKFAIEKMFVNNISVKSCKKNDIVVIFCNIIPKKEQDIFHLTSRYLDIADINENKFVSYQIPLDIKVTLTNDQMKINFTFDFQEFEFSEKVIVEQAKNEKDFINVLFKFFMQADKKNICVKNISFINKTIFSSDKIFMPPSVLKNYKNNFYIYLINIAKKSYEIKEAEFLEESNKEKFEFYKHIEINKTLIPILERKKLNPETNSLIPFIDIDNIKLDSKICFLALPPLILNEKIIKKLEKIIIENKDKKIIIGLNNISHIYFSKRLSLFENVFFFTDFFIYIANRFSLKFYLKNIDKLLFSYYWIEDNKNISQSFKIPIFYSLACFYKHNFEKQCSNDCKKDFSFEIYNNKKKFKVIVKDCVTYVFQD